MRTWLWNLLHNAGWLIADWKADGKLISSGSADQPEPPFMLLGMQVEQPFPGMPASAKTGEIPFTVWVHDTPGSMLRIDEACIALQNNLPTEDGFMIGNMSVLRVKWTETGQDSFDDHFKTNCRPVRFAMVTAK